MSRRFVYFALAGFVVGGLIVGLPMVLERVVHAELDERLARRGASVTWSQLAWSWPSSVELEDVELSAAGGRISGQVTSVSADVALGDLVAGRVRLDGVSVREAALEVDLAGGKAPPAKAVESGASPTSSLGSWLAHVDELRGRDVEVRVLRGGAKLGALRIEQARATRSASEAMDVEADGVLSVEPAVVAGQKLPELTWSANGTLTSRPPVLQLSVGHGQSDRDLLAFDLGDTGHLNVAGADVILRADPADPLSVTLREVDARLGAAQSPAVALEAHGLSISRVRSPSPRVGLERPIVSVAPGRLGALRRQLAGRRASSAPDDGSASAPGSGWKERLTWWLSRIEARVDGARVDLWLDGPDESVDEITIVERLAATASAGQIAALGQSAGGQFEIYGVVEPGRLLPRMVSLKAAGVRLEDLPGIDQGRTLPKRGVRGKVGGTVDASLLLITDGQPLVRPSPDAAVTLVTSIQWRDGRLEVSGLADRPLEGIDTEMTVGLEWAPALGRVSLQSGRASWGPIDVELGGELVDWPFDPVLDLRARVAEIGCQEAVRSFPGALLGPYDGIEIKGEAAPEFGLHYPMHHPQELELSLDGFVDKCHVTALNADKEAWPQVGFARPARVESSASEEPLEDESDPSGVLLEDDSVENSNALAPTWPVPPVVAELDYELPHMPQGRDPSRLDDVWWLNRPFIKPVVEGVSEEAEVVVGPGTQAYAPLAELPPFVGAAAYLSEEIPFYRNHGVDLGLIQKAVRMNLEGGRFVYGGSTVTQQLVKNLFLTRDKTLARKLEEALIAWRIEEVVPKWRVLELYLNCIEYAQDVYGIGPAARHYFGKDARQLTPKEAVFIAILKPAPWYGARFRRRGGTPTRGWWFHRMGEIMGRLVEKGYLSAEQAEAQKPYILSWDDEGNYLPGVPAEAPSAAAERAQSANESGDRAKAATRGGHAPEQ